MEPLAIAAGHKLVLWIKGYKKEEIPDVWRILRSGNVDHMYLQGYLAGLIDGDDEISYTGLLKAIGLFTEYAKYEPDNEKVKYVLAVMLEAAATDHRYEEFVANMGEIYAIFDHRGLLHSLNDMLLDAYNQQNNLAIYSQ